MAFNSIQSNLPCFCGSKSDFASCCKPYIDKTRQVETGEQLMRSRFSAYACGNAQYIYDTYAAISQVEQSVEDIDDWSQSCVWIALTIHSKEATLTTTEQFVEFSAFYITNNVLCELREKSRFGLEANIGLNENSKQWRYIDGDIIAHNELANIKRNSLCPCNNYPTTWITNKGKKFKHCCGK